MRIFSSLFSSAGSLLLFGALLTATLPANGACFTDRSTPGCVRYHWLTSSATDSYTYAPSAAQKTWIGTHMNRITTFNPYWDSRLSWAPNAWAYRDVSSLYTWDTVASAHPDWILYSDAGEPLYINWGCSNGRCPQYAADYSNPDFRNWWIAQARSIISKGYKGLFIDDVNFIFNLTTGSKAKIPVDPNTRAVMSLTNYEKYQADFLTMVRQAFPSAEICHNSIWYGGTGFPNTDPYVAQQVKAANYLNLERGFADTGLTGDGGLWSIQNVFTFIDQVHALGTSVLPHQYYTDGQFSLAAYLLISNGKDLFGNDSINPNNWPSLYDMDLGANLGQRYVWNGLIRRNFANGLVLLNPPGKKAVTMRLGGEYVDASGNIVTEVTLNGRQAIVLKRRDALADGTYTLTNAASNLFLDCPGGSTRAGQSLVQWSGNNTNYQNWILTSQGGSYFKIKSRASNLFLTSQSAAGSAAVQQPESSDDNQVWELRPISTPMGTYYLVNRATGLTLLNSGPSLTNGAVMTTGAFAESTAQQWILH